MGIYVALLRGINVGGNKIIPMADFRKLCETLGFAQVQSYLQSGNIVFSQSKSNVAAIRDSLTTAIESTFGFQCEVIIRTPKELQSVIANSPFKIEQEQPSKLAVMFLQDKPSTTAKADLLDSFRGPDKIHLSQSEAYLFYPDGMARSKLSNAFLEKKLHTSGTARNWNTCTRLLAMVNQSE